MHHSVCDGSSPDILDKRLRAAPEQPNGSPVEALPAGSPTGVVPLQPREMIALERGEQLMDVREAVRVLRERPLSGAIMPEASAAPGFVKHEVELDCAVGLDHRTGHLVLRAQAPPRPEPWADSLVDRLVEELISLIELD
jgi:hypothetical protein